MATNALEIAWNPNSRDDFAKIRRHQLRPRDRRDRLFLDIALQYIKADEAVADEEAEEADEEASLNAFSSRL